MLHVGVRLERSISDPKNVRKDEDAVGGFFEDLPVLVLVLCGVATIIAASIWSSGRIADERLDEDLRETAERFADRLVEAAQLTEGVEYPTIDKLRALNITRLAAGLPEDTGYAVSLVQVFPSLEWILQHGSREKPVSEDACASSRLVNAVDEWSRVVIVEVRVVVW